MLEPGVPELRPTITRDGKDYVLRARTRLVGAREKIFEFFSDARNLERLTPALLKFHVVTPDPIVMREGALLDYKLKIHHIPDVLFLVRGHMFF